MAVHRAPYTTHSLLSTGARGTQPGLPSSHPADTGTVLKVIILPKGSRPSAEGLLLEELHVFEVRPPRLQAPHSPHPIKP